MVVALSAPSAADTGRACAASGRFVVIGASAGGLHALKEVLGALPADFPAPVAIVLHRSTAQPNLSAAVLGRATPLPVKLADDGERPLPGHVYLARPDMHLTLTPSGTFHLVNGRRIRHVRSSADPLFDSAAEVFGDKVIAIVLTGGDSDATDGVQSVARAGGWAIAEDPASAAYPQMPSSAIATGAVESILPLEQIAPELIRRVAGVSARA